MNLSQKFVIKKLYRSTHRKIIRFENSKSGTAKISKIMAKFYDGCTEKMFQVHSHIQLEYSRSNGKEKIQSVNLLEKEHQNVRIAAFIIYRKMMMRNAYHCIRFSNTLRRRSRSPSGYLRKSGESRV